MKSRYPVSSLPSTGDAFSKVEGLPTFMDAAYCCSRNPALARQERGYPIVTQSGWRAGNGGLVLAHYEAPIWGNPLPVLCDAGKHMLMIGHDAIMKGAAIHD